MTTICLPPNMLPSGRRPSEMSFPEIVAETEAMGLGFAAAYDNWGMLAWYDPVNPVKPLEYCGMEIPAARQLLH